MITLKHLTVEQFRLLREMNLHFPQRGSILIQGPNEAGKSTLLESIYFALYGEPLTPFPSLVFRIPTDNELRSSKAQSVGKEVSLDREKRLLDDLVQYGAIRAFVTLTFSIGATEMTVTRTIERGVGQQVTLFVRKLGMPEEGPITRLATANERIIKELGHVDGETLRNSCLIEQKGLERLETLRGSERETTIRKLLGLEKLTRMTEHFSVTLQDERLFKEASDRLQLAEVQVRIPELSAKLEQIEAALDAVTIAEGLVDVAQQEEEIAEQDTIQTQLHSRRSELTSRQGRVAQLKKADITLAEIISAYEAMAEAQQELPLLEKQIEELERREHEELPTLEKRVADLVELTQLFATLQRMSNDLLAVVDSIKVLEHDLRHHEELQAELQSLTEQVHQAQTRVHQAQQSLYDLEERRLAGRPLLEGRLVRMCVLAERLVTLRQVEEQYARHLNEKDEAQENEARLRKIQHDLYGTEQELVLVENEAKQTQQRNEDLEKRWQQLSYRRQLEKWQRLKGMAQGISEAEQHVRVAHQRQEKLTLASLESRGITRRHLLLAIICIALFVVCVVVALLEIQHTQVIAIIAIVAALALAGVAGLSFQNYGKARREERITDQQMQEAINRVGMMVAAREAAMRVHGSQKEEAINIEHEIQSLGGSIPCSLEEANRLLQQISDNGESLSDLQKHIQAKRDEANASRNQVNVTMEAIATLRKERGQLEERRQQEGWADIETNLRQEQATLERMHQEIILLAAQEGLPQSSINVRIPLSSTPGSFSGIPFTPVLETDTDAGVPELEVLVESTIKATERELASLDGKLDLAADLSGQSETYQDALDVLLGRKRSLEEHMARYEKYSPAQQLEQTREQQAGLRNALHVLQDSLRQRVKLMGLAFGQAAINSAETAARRQLNELHITLGHKVTLEAKHGAYTALLKDRQESLSEHYAQLSKFSNSLGSWIVPLNPFAESLAALRTRCQNEIQEANELGMVQELEKLQQQEGASQAKVMLCRQDIEEVQERIAATLVQRKRPHPKSYTQADIVAIWPLLDTYTVSDRSRLEVEHKTTEQELMQLEEQELALSTQLHMGGAKLDLEQARARMEQQERSYQTKQRGNMLVKAVNERLMRKMLPRTEYYMQRILPLLTSGRYHDIHLITEVEEGASSGGPFSIQVWDTAAGEYVSKSALSGGAADQLSLALRLAFAIAALPRELSVAPGFVILDEPLSSFDRKRAQALADVVSSELVSNHFEQVLLISQSNAFDPAMFPYHLYIDNGAVIESNLPVVHTPTKGAMNVAPTAYEDINDMGEETLVMTAIPK